MKERHPKKTTYRIRRIILSMVLPVVVGVLLHAVLSGLIGEPLYYLGLLYALPSIMLFMLLPSAVYAAVMEYTGKKIIRGHELRDSGWWRGPFFVCLGVALGGGLGWVMEPGFDFMLIGCLTGVTVSPVLLILHIKETRSLQGDV